LADNVAGVKSNIGIGTVQHNSNPNRNITEDELAMAIFGGLFPTEVHEIHRQELDLFLIEDFDCLGMKETLVSQIATL
jgi:hypothetical protein